MFYRYARVRVGVMDVELTMEGAKVVAYSDDLMWSQAERMRYPDIVEPEDVESDSSGSEGQSERVNHPAHYAKAGVECIDVMESVFGRAALLDFCTLNAFKYVWRADSKGCRREDLEKARWYLGKAVGLLDSEADSTDISK